MQFLKSLTLLAIVACKVALADEANEPFRCVRRAPEAADERVAVCGGVSKTDPNKYDMTLANTPIDDQDVRNCVGTKLDETRCCRKSAFKLKPNLNASMPKINLPLDSHPNFYSGLVKLSDLSIRRL
ncbi:hypothetical protein PGT21_003519 [Puccinia graminis f. sp. tritici]|uniref:Hydrophobin n=1 Tax=Puccinia graminis f. sp. tritici TaxID=56615 RepID=A0A5B0QHE0_PUCGR|nr:hypothetical protein PGT21_003519 [Puccinia graminis f. sp. tritici]